MYPRNNATPPVITLGEIVLKSDGTQQTTGASARVKIGTGAWGAAAGTLACDSTSGMWTYAPTQAETNADFFLVAAYKSACTSVGQTIITTGSATAGRALLSAETHTGAVIPTVSAVTGLTAANLDVAVSTRMATYTQPTGFLAATFPTGTIANTTNISSVATVAGTVGSIAGITFPTNFASLGINASGHITRVVLADTVTTLTNLPTIPANWLTAAGIATDAGTELATALLDLTDGIETGLTLRGATRLIAAASAGKLSGAATTTVTIRNVGDTKARLTATVDADGNRSAVTTDAT